MSTGAAPRTSRPNSSKVTKLLTPETALISCMLVSVSSVRRFAAPRAGAKPASNRDMRYLALATDYDGTLAHNGRVTESTLTALEALRASGRKLMMVTGRELPDLKTVFPALELFDRVVVENGSLLYNPSTHQESLIAEEPPPEFVARLKKSGIPF